MDISQIFPQYRCASPLIAGVSFVGYGVASEIGTHGTCVAWNGPHLHRKWQDAAEDQDSLYDSLMIKDNWKGREGYFLYYHRIVGVDSEGFSYIIPDEVSYSSRLQEVRRTLKKERENI